MLLLNKVSVLRLEKDKQVVERALINDFEEVYETEGDYHMRAAQTKDHACNVT